MIQDNVVNNNWMMSCQETAHHPIVIYNIILNHPVAFNSRLEKVTLTNLSDFPEFANSQEFYHLFVPTRAIYRVPTINRSFIAANTHQLG